MGFGLNELAISPAIEWKPLNGIGIQLGLLYSKSNWSTTNIDSSEKIVSSWSSGANQDGENVLNGLNIAQLRFHTLSIPLFFRFYPGNDR